MSIVQRIKEVAGIDAYEHAYRCRECGETFESNQDPDSYWLSCPECDGEDVEQVQRANARN